jgi:uncharacterized OsmC-like protein
MDATSLRELQAPLKERYKKEPNAAVITLKARGSLDEGISCKVETGRAIAVAGLHPATGGSGHELCSGDMLLEALVACAGVTLRAVSTAYGIDIKSGSVEKEAPVGFRSIRLTFNLDTDASPENLDKLLATTERYCVVLQTIKKGVPAEAKIVKKR